ncbi:cleavage and polyadenylation specificity factor subunit 3-like [Symsagittifera roscoffensis]|uniref:cleavage and polyadenylation specificity factor subunit 3-like n=1 Tax=Symsagittifera roscoffensis TaxID=84072 RepID=UPI00307B2D6A
MSSIPSSGQVSSADGLGGGGGAGVGVTVTGSDGSERDPSDYLSITPLGAGQEVGRSCIMLEYKTKKIMLDCGIHPGHHGFESLPYIEHVEPSEIDFLLVTHFHLDHCGALPYFLTKTAFKGRCFMTHATKSIYKLLMSDYLKVSNIGSDDMLFSETDLDASMEKIETINFHQVQEISGVKFWCYHAGHVLGACMFMIEIAGVRVLYTGDYSCEEDRHLMKAEVPQVKPHVLISEATYGTYLHDNRMTRETRFTGKVHEIIRRGGRCLIPVFALGRAQELLLILDEYWSQQPELQDVPIYYASSLAKRCMPVYLTFSNAMNEKMRKQMALRNPFAFRHVSNLKSIDHFDDIGPSVVMASPGMMQSGLSRELFESWCTDFKNGVIIAGYSVEGTMARDILAQPEEVTSMSGMKLPLKCSVDYISFSAHVDYRQVSEFVRALQPPHLILVHGEETEMGRLHNALGRQYENSASYQPKMYMPKNSQKVQLFYPGEKMAKVMGSLAVQKPQMGQKVSGVLLKRNFNYHLLNPKDINHYTDLTISRLSQKLSVPFTRSFATVQVVLQQLCGLDDVILNQGVRFSLKVYNNSITVTLEDGICILEWEASTVSDMYADAVVAALLKSEEEKDEPSAKRAGKSSLLEVSGEAELGDCMFQLLCDIYGDGSVSAHPEHQQVRVRLGSHMAAIDLKTFEVICEDDVDLKLNIEESISRLKVAMKDCLQNTN